MQPSRAFLDQSNSGREFARSYPENRSRLTPAATLELRRCVGFAVLFAVCVSTASPSASEVTNGVPPSTNLPPYQIITTNPPPLSPARFDPDPGAPPFRTNITGPEVTLRLERITNAPPPPEAPRVFNPDPGAMLKPPATNRPFFTNEIAAPPGFQGRPVPQALALPRTNVFGDELEFVEPPAGTNYGWEPLPKNLALPRQDTRANEYIHQKWDYPEYPIAWHDYSLPPFTEPETNRWRIGFVPWERYTSGDIETPYETPKPMLWHPYKQSILKGDAPIIGQNIFLDLTAGSETEVEGRRIPTPSGVSPANPNSPEFYGNSDQFFVQNNFSFTVDLFEGDTVFQPVHWALRLEPVYNVNYTYTHENNVISPNPQHGTDR